MRDHPSFSKHRREAWDPIFPFAFFLGQHLHFFPTDLMKNYWNLSQRIYFLKASSWSSKSQAQIFTSKFGSFSVHCVNYHEPLCMQKAGVWNVLPIGQRNIFFENMAFECKHTAWNNWYSVSVYKWKNKIIDLFNAIIRQIFTQPFRSWYTSKISVWISLSSDRKLTS